MSDWEQDSEGSDAPAASTGGATAAPIKPILKKSKWEDEDAEDEVKDDWDASDASSDSDSEEERKKKAAAAAKPVRRKGITKQKIAEKEAAEQAKAEAKAVREAEAADPAAKRRREQQQQLEADLDSARSLFGDSSLTTPTNPLSQDPKTREQFDSLATELSQSLVSKHSSKPLYAMFVESLVKKLVEPLNDVECRKVASGVTAIGNEKQAKAKAAQKGGKKKAAKPAANLLKGGGGATKDLNAYDDPLDYDDFM